MGALATVLVVLAILAAAASIVARRHRPYVEGMHALRDDFARDPVSGPLRAGCASFEVGVSLDGGGRLQVGDPSTHDAGNTLGPMVLRRLALRAQEFHGRVRPGQTGSVRLMVEILETEADRQARAYEALNAALGAYPRLWTRIDDGAVTLGPVTVVLIGTAVPRHLVSAQSDRYVFCDGSFGDIGAWGAPLSLVPTVSEHWSWRFGWDGTEEMPTEERVLLRRFVAAAHQDGRQVRIFGIPERPAPIRDAFWRELTAAGVDVISTREPRRLRRFLSRPVAVAPSQIGTEAGGRVRRFLSRPVAAAPSQIGNEAREGSREAVSAR
ncbi:MAG TPA: hypothetical protein VGF84_17300 [Micromonosporaceae bacterium]